MKYVLTILDYSAYEKPEIKIFTLDEALSEKIDREDYIDIILKRLGYQGQYDESIQFMLTGHMLDIRINSLTSSYIDE